MSQYHVLEHNNSCMTIDRFQKTLRYPYETKTSLKQRKPDKK